MVKRIGIDLICWGLGLEILYDQCGVNRLSKIRKFCRNGEFEVAVREVQPVKSLELRYIIWYVSEKMQK